MNGALSPTARSNLKGNTQPATQFINCQIQYTFSDGTSATDRTSFGTNNNAFLSSGLNQTQVDARIATLVNDTRILDLAKPTRFAADRGKLMATAPTNQDSIVLISPPPIVVVTDRDAQPIKATGTRGTGTEAARNDHVHPLKLAANGGLSFATNDSLQIAIRPLVVVAWDASRASYADVVLPSNYANWSEVVIVINDKDNKHETVIWHTAGMATDIAAWGETGQDRIKWTTSSRTIASTAGTKGDFRFIYVALRP